MNIGEPWFDGATYDHDRDGARLGKQMAAVCDVMLGKARGEWFTLGELSELTGAPEASVSARLRDLRKPRFGSYIVERRFIQNGLHGYRVPAAVVTQRRLI